MTKYVNKIQHGSASSSAEFSVKQFIKSYDFTSPSWDNLPSGFPNVDDDGLTREEAHLLEAIKMAWLVADERRSYTIYKYILVNRMAGLRIANTTLTLIFASGFFMFLISMTYYLNIKYHLGLAFLTEFFA
jgi:hypothetical protein